MTVPAFLEELRSRNIRVWAEGDQLRCTAPAGVLTPALRDRLRREKSAIVQFLRAADALTRQDRAIVPLHDGGGRVPIFAVPGHNGNVFSFRFLAQALGEDQPFFGLQPPGVDGECQPLTRVEELAAFFVPRILAFRPAPYVIAGHCSGGTIAFELARQLVQQGATVEMLALFGSPYPAWFGRVPQMMERVAHQAEWLRGHVRTLAPMSNRERGAYFAARMAERRRQRRAGGETPGEIARDASTIQRDGRCGGDANGPMPLPPSRIQRPGRVVLPKQVAAQRAFLAARAERHRRLRGGLRAGGGGGRYDAARALCAGDCRAVRELLAAIGTVFRAGDRTRTGDVQLGKLAFYQLNYARNTA